MKNHIFIILFLLGFLSNKTVFAMANKAAYSTEQTIKHKRTSYLEKVCNKHIEKIVKNNSNFSEKTSKKLEYLFLISWLTTFGITLSCVILSLAWLITLGGIGINLGLLLGGVLFFGLLSVWLWFKMFQNSK
jgi:hypothetical protein